MNKATPWSKLLRKWRDALNITAPQAAEKLGIPFDTYRGWEFGKHTPSKFVRRALMAAMRPQTASDKVSCESPARRPG